MSKIGFLVALALVGSAEAHPSEVTFGVRYGEGPPVPWVDDEPDSQRLGLTGGWGTQLREGRPFWVTVRGSYSLAGSSRWTNALDGVGAMFTYLEGMFELRTRAQFFTVGAGVGPLLGVWADDVDFTGLGGGMLGFHGAGFIEVGSERAGLRLFVDGGVLHTTAGARELARTGFELEAGALVAIYLR